jgi:hypothetical protein
MPILCTFPYLKRILMIFDRRSKYELYLLKPISVSIRHTLLYLDWQFVCLSHPTNECLKELIYTFACLLEGLSHARIAKKYIFSF